MRAFACLVLGLALAACPKIPKGGDEKQAIEHGSGSGHLLPGDAAATATLPVAPPLPEVPFGLPSVPAGALDGVTPEAVAMGSALFHDPRLASDGKTTCTTCHDPDHRFAGIAPAKGDKLPPQIENLAWNPRAIETLPAHVADVMHQDLATAAAKLAVPYEAHLARVGGSPAEAVEQALVAFVVTRFDGNSPWDHQERAAAKPVREAEVDAAAGYKIFTGKGRCATCHTPPLYTDFRSHDLGSQTHNVTRSLRGASQRKSYFLADSAHSMTAVLEFYMADQRHNELHKLVLSGPEQVQLLAFLGALSGDVPTTILQPLP
ncbi:MAG: cytochrome c peroxidase [Kofleriaceae bacterium]